MLLTWPPIWRRLHDLRHKQGKVYPLGMILALIILAKPAGEDKAAPALIEGLGLKNRVICGDAMHTQRELSVDVLAQGDHYLWLLKDNRSTLPADAEQFFQPPQKAAEWPLPPLPSTTARTTNKQHGRLEQRSLTPDPLTLMSDGDGFLDWSGVRQVLRRERRTLHLRTGGTIQRSCLCRHQLSSGGWRG